VSISSTFYWQLDCIFALLGSTYVKAAHKMWWNWPLWSISSTFDVHIFHTIEKAAKTMFVQKIVRKMLMKLTPALLLLASIVDESILLSFYNFLTFGASLVVFTTIRSFLSFDHNYIKLPFETHFISQMESAMRNFGRLNLFGWDGVKLRHTGLITKTNLALPRYFKFFVETIIYILYRRQN